MQTSAELVWTEATTQMLEQEIQKYVKHRNLKETKADACMFISKKRDQLLIIAIFVDDGLVALTTDEQFYDLIICLKQL